MKKSIHIHNQALRPVTLVLTILFSAFGTTGLSQDLDNSTTTILRRADSLMAAYQFKSAIELLSVVNHDDVEVMMRRGQGYFQLGAYTEAIGQFERVLEMDTLNRKALNLLGQLYSRVDEELRALSCYEKLIALDSLNSYYYKQGGNICVRSGEPIEATAWYRRALDLNPDDLETSMALGDILLELERFEAVDELATRVLASDPEFKPALQLSARSAFGQRQYDTTITRVNALLQQADTTAAYARLLGISYYHVEEYEKMAACMNFLLANRFDFEWIYYYMGVGARASGDVTGSIQWMSKAIEKSVSENIDIYYSHLGQSYEEAGNYQAAIQAYRAAFNYSGKGILLYHLARNYDVYYKDKSTAILYYQKYLDSEDTIRAARDYAKKRMQDEGYF